MAISIPASDNSDDDTRAASAEEVGGENGPEVGFDEAKVRTVGETARSLKFDQHGFEDD